MKLINLKLMLDSSLFKDSYLLKKSFQGNFMRSSRVLNRYQSVGFIDGFAYYALRYKTKYK